MQGFEGTLAVPGFSRSRHQYNLGDDQRYGDQNHHCVSVSQLLLVIY